MSEYRVAVGGERVPRRGTRVHGHHQESTEVPEGEVANVSARNHLDYVPWRKSLRAG